MKTCFIYLCHVFNEETIKRYNHIKQGCDELGYDIWWFYDNTHNDYKLNEIENVYCFKKEDLLRVYGKLIYLTEWDTGFNGVFSLLDFSKQHKYDYYWFCEFDVVYKGNWSYFLNHFDSYDSDLLAEYVNGYKDAQFIFWGEISKEKKYLEIGLKAYMNNFITANIFLMRLSNRLVKALIGHYENNHYDGFEEWVIPSVANEYGFKINDIGGHGKFTKELDKDIFYILFDNLNPLGTISWENKYTYEYYKFLPQNMLVHPFKLDKKIIL